MALQSMITLPMAGRQAFGGMMLSGGVQFVFVILAPILILIGLFVVSGLLFLAGKILGDAEEGFEATFKVVAYSSTSNLAQIIPFCGGMIGGIWALILYIVGLKQAHRTETWKAVLTPFLVLALCCLCVAVITMVFGVGLASLAGAARSMQ